MKIAIIEGYGPNEVVIPCMVMESFDKALDFAKKAFGVEDADDIYYEDSNDMESEGTHIFRIEKQCDGMCDNGNEGNCNDCSRRPEKNPELEEKIIQTFFKRYYGGCGECYSIGVREIEFGERLVGWDLD